MTSPSRRRWRGPTGGLASALLRRSVASGGSERPTDTLLPQFQTKIFGMSFAGRQTSTGWRRSRSWTASAPSPNRHSLEMSEFSSGTARQSQKMLGSNPHRLWTSIGCSHAPVPCTVVGPQWAWACALAVCQTASAETHSAPRRHGVPSASGDASWCRLLRLARLPADLLCVRGSGK